MLSEKAVDILTYVRVSKDGRRWIDCEKEFVKERGWPKGTYVKYWKEIKNYLEKKPDPKRPGRFRYFIRQGFESEPEKAMLRQRIGEKKVLVEGSVELSTALKEKYARALGKIIEENVYGDPYKAWRLVVNLAKTAPPAFKERFHFSLVAAKKVYDEKMGGSENPLKKWLFVRNNIIPFLLDKFSTLLYET